jgi:hypothetical protein
LDINESENASFCGRSTDCASSTSATGWLWISARKKLLNLPVYDPSREKRIFARMKEDNPGPLDDGAIVRLFERVIDESRRLERIMSHGETEEEPQSK